MRYAGVVTTVAFLWIVAYAQEKVLDPVKDERLNRTLSLRLAGVPLYRALRQITQTTEVSLLAEDRVREHRVVVYAPNQPLHLVLEHIASAFGYEWKRLDYPDQPPVYRLVDPKPPTPSDKDDWKWFMEELLPRMCEALKKTPQERQKMYAEVLEEIERLKNQEREEFFKPENLKALKEKMTQRRALQYTLYGSQHIAQALCSLSGADWKRLQNGELLLLSTRNGTLPSHTVHEWVDYKRSFLHSWTEQEKSWLREDPHDLPSGVDIGKAIADLEVKLQHSLKALDTAQELRLFLWYNSETSILQALDAVVDQQGRKLTSDDLNLTPLLFSGMKALFVEPIEDEELVAIYQENQSSEAPLPKHRAFHKKLERFRPPSLDEDWFAWKAELLVQMAEASDICLVAEFYPFLPDFETESDITESLLSRLFEKSLSWDDLYRFLHAWEYRAVISEQEWLVIAYSDSAWARSLDIPQANIERWFYKPNRRGILSLEDCAEIRGLPYSSDYMNLWFPLMLQLESPLSWDEYSPLLRGIPLEIESLHRGILYAIYSLDLDYFEGESYEGETHEGEHPENSHPLRRCLPKSEQEAEIDAALDLFRQLSSTQRAFLKRGGVIPFKALTPVQQVQFLKAMSRYELEDIAELWLPPQELSAFLDTASLRLVADTCERDGVQLTPTERQRIKTLKDWAMHRQTAQTQPVKVRHRVWRFEFRWGDKTHTASIVMPYPVHKETK
ncbi:MAG: hypothetical protein SNJ72_04830 [Fimbriimonadales bacterium]